MKLFTALIGMASAQFIELPFFPNSAEPQMIDLANSGLEELTALIEAGLRSPAPRPPVNPCASDQESLHCSSASCLKQHFDQLSESCRDFLRGPAPSPGPQVIRTVESEAVGGFDLNREGYHFSGTVPIEMELPMNGLFSLLPPEIVDLFLGGAVTASTPARSSQTASSHPCKAEVNHCSKKFGSKSHDDHLNCLVSMYEKLSPSCKCFLHEVMGEDEVIRKAMPAKLQPAESPKISTTSIESDEIQVAGLKFVRLAPSDPMPPPMMPTMPPMHHFWCMFLMLALMLVMVQLLRRCVLCCCVHESPRFAAVVPPQQTAIKTVQPLLVSNMKIVPALSK